MSPTYRDRGVQTEVAKPQDSSFHKARAEKRTERVPKVYLPSHRPTTAACSLRVCSLPEASENGIVTRLANRSASLPQDLAIGASRASDIYRSLDDLSLASDDLHTPSSCSPSGPVSIVREDSQLSCSFVGRMSSTNAMEKSSFSTPNVGLSQVVNSSPPRPIPSLIGPLSLPYARCPSGAEGTVIEGYGIKNIWGLDKDGGRHHREQAPLHLNATLRETPLPIHFGGGLVMSPPSESSRLNESKNPTFRILAPQEFNHMEDFALHSQLLDEPLETIPHSRLEGSTCAGYPLDGLGMRFAEDRLRLPRETLSQAIQLDGSTPFFQPSHQSFAMDPYMYPTPTDNQSQASKFIPPNDIPPLNMCSPIPPDATPYLSQSYFPSPVCASPLTPETPLTLHLPPVFDSEHSLAIWEDCSGCDDSNQNNQRGIKPHVAGMLPAGISPPFPSPPPNSPLPPMLPDTSTGDPAFQRTFRTLQPRSVPFKRMIQQSLASVPEEDENNPPSGEESVQSSLIPDVNSTFRSSNARASGNQSGSHSSSRRSSQTTKVKTPAGGGNWRPVNHGRIHAGTLKCPLDTMGVDRV